MEVREARRSDKGPLMSFIKDVWGGHDYIPLVWDEWIRDRDAKMFVVLADGRQVGMNRVRFMEDGSAWLEGARVHPDYRGRGLATALGERSMEVGKTRGVKTFRLTSGSHNKMAHRQIARIGFGEASRFSVYITDGRLRARAEGAIEAKVGDGPSILRRVRRTREFALGSGVMWDVFAAMALTPEVVRKAVDEGSVFTLGDSVAIERLGSEGGGLWRQVSFVGGDPVDARRLVVHLLTRRMRRKTDRSLVYLPQRSPIIKELRKAGMKRDFSLILFERRTAKG